MTVTFIPTLRLSYSQDNVTPSPYQGLNRLPPEHLVALVAVVVVVNRHHPSAPTVPHSGKRANQPKHIEV